MKRCPTCNQTFSEGWLSFCTQDGTTLIEEPAPQGDPMATMLAPPPPALSNQNQPAGWSTPSGGIGSGQFQPPQPMQNVWQPPPPPPYSTGPKQGTAVAALCCGIFTVTIGWGCYLGVITGPVAIGLGIYSLVPIKNYPDKFTRKPFAINRNFTGAPFLSGLAPFILTYCIAVFLSSR